MSRHCSNPQGNGLLQAMENFGITGKTLTFNFAFYVTLTKEKRLSFKEFLSDGSTTDVISDKFLTDQMKCFRLFRCFYKAGDVKMCQCIEESKAFDFLNKKELMLQTTGYCHLIILNALHYFSPNQVLKLGTKGSTFIAATYRTRGLDYCTTD